MLTTEPTETNMDNIPAASDQQVLVVVAIVIWENVSGNAIRYRTEPDVEKKADKSIGVGETVAGVIEGEWLNTADGLYLPAQHPDRGQALPSHSAAVFGRRLLQRWCRRCLIGLACKFLFWIVIFAIISAMSPPKCCDETCEKCTES